MAKLKQKNFNLLKNKNELIIIILLLFSLI